MENLFIGLGIGAVIVGGGLLILAISIAIELGEGRSFRDIFKGRL